MKSCRRSIAAEHGVMLSSVILLKTRTIPKTTSGKIARSWCRRGYQEGTLSVLSRWDATDGAGEEEGYDDIDLTGPSDASQGAAREKQANSSAGKYATTEEPGEEERGVRSKPSLAEIRGLSIDDIVLRLEETLKQISAQSPAPITVKMNKLATLSSLGLDSFTIVQFKGVLEKRSDSDANVEHLNTRRLTPHSCLAKIMSVVSLRYRSSFTLL
jgi:hypothetical protein